MKFLPKHRKLIYVPGMISLLLLPIVGYTYFHYNKSFVVYGSMDLGLSDKNSEEFVPMFKGDRRPFTTDEVEAMRKFRTITFNGSEASEKQKLDALQRDFRQLKIRKDSINGIKVHFDKQAQYGTFIRVLDLLAIEDMPTYELRGNDIYVLVSSPKPQSNTVEMSKPHVIQCGYGSANREYFAELERQRNHETFIALLKKDWRVITALLALMLINILALIRFNKNKVLYLNNHSKWRF